MEVAISAVSDYLINPFLPEGYKAPQFWPATALACYLLLYIGGRVFYFGVAYFQYYYFWERNREKYYPHTVPYEKLQAQMKDEKEIAVRNMAKMAALMTPFTFGVSQGWSKTYYNVDDYGWPYLIASIFMFFVFTDFMIYWVHRLLHYGLVYKYIHKEHHTYRYTTPFSSHAFHWVDGWSQGVQYYVFVYLFPFHHILFIVMFIFVNCWTVMIHDQIDFVSPSKVILSTGHHTIHHAQFNYNYGQYFTFWDRLCGTYLPAPQTNELITGKRLSPPAPKLPEDKQSAKKK
eukprot:TRINITY_DN2672_c0_g1_i1.p1 TRINITY_DN2672_c0_g1~~TRINITY_DN2672_c0_g1_i1.p1  ORF type:complete len:289 (-),score=48.21 TRINITY_DN2672_c0_g1_i1:52-918(-)